MIIFSNDLREQIGNNFKKLHSNVTIGSPIIIKNSSQSDQNSVPISAIFFSQDCPNEKHGKHKNKPMRKSCFFIMKTPPTLHNFFISNTLISNTRLRLDPK